jgi:hypothetical protein
VQAQLFEDGVEDRTVRNDGLIFFADLDETGIAGP